MSAAPEDPALPPSLPPLTPAERLAPLAVFLVSLAALGWAAAPSVTPHDSGEFALAARSFGIPHPPGAPTYALLAGIWVRLAAPLSPDTARLTNLFSALLGAVTLGLLTAVAREWVGRGAAATRLPAAARAAAAVTPAAVLLGCPAFVEQSAVTEQYTLLTALLCAALLWAARGPAVAPQRPAAYGAAGGLIAGLALGNHPSQLVLIPFVAASAVMAAGRTRLAALADAAGGLAVGLLVFLYLPLRAAAMPLLDWGRPDSPARLAAVISRVQWRTRPVSEAPPGFAADWFATYDLPGQVGWIALLLAALGTFALLRGAIRRAEGAPSPRREAAVLAGTTVLYAAGMLLAHLQQDGIDAQYLRSYGVVDWHLPIYLFFALFAGLGLAALAVRAAGAAGNRRAAVLAAVVGAALWANGLYRAAVPLSLHDFDAPRRAADASLALVPTGAVLLTNADSVSFPLAYALYAGPGAAAETRWMAFASSGVPKRVGSAEAAGGWRPADRAALLAQVRARAAKSGPLTPPAPFPTLPSVPVFTDDAGDRPATARHFLPAGLLFELRDAPVSVAEVRAAEAHRRAEQPYLLRPAAPDENRLTRDMLGRQHLRRAAYFFALGMWPEADGAARLTLTYRPWEGAAWFLLGSCLENEGRPADAAAAYAGAIDAEPGLDGPRTNLAVLLATSGRGGEARPLLVEELRLHPANAEARTNLARLDRAFAAGVTNQK